MKHAVVLAMTVLCIVLLIPGAAAGPADVAGAWTPTGSLNATRSFHTATLLADGRVLVAGGYSDGPAADAEIYNPATGLWSVTGSLGTARIGHSATRLADGRVLVAGGSYEGTTLASAELYDPATGLWSAAADMTSARQGHTATLLVNGLVLVAAGMSDYGDLASAELYDPATGLWTPTGSLCVPRRAAEATELADGRVLVSGGLGADVPLASVELYDPATGLWAVTDSLDTNRYNHSATRLADGRVLAAGGTSEALYPVPLTGCELYDPATGQWEATGELNTARLTHSASLLPDGRVLAAGGLTVDVAVLDSAEIYDPATGQWSFTASLNTARSSHTATLLGDGRVLAAAGWDGAGCLGSAELYAEEAASMHVAAILGHFDLDPYGRTRLLMRVGVEDASLAPLGDVQVTASIWDPDGGPFQRTRFTKPSGYARFVWGSNRSGMWQLCVDDLTREGYVYNPDDNVITCREWQH